MLILLAGLPGTGKSAIGEALAGELGVPLFSVDPIESAILDAGVGHGFASGLAAYAVAMRLTDEHLGRGLTVVADAVNDAAEARDRWREIAARRRVHLRVIECVCSDEEVHRTRLAARLRGLSFPEPSWADVVLRRTRWVEWPEQVVTVDSVNPLADNLTRVLAGLGAR